MTTRPNEHERWLGRIDISLEVAIDEPAELFAQDMAIALERLIAARAGADTYGWSATVLELTGDPVTQP